MLAPYLPKTAIDAARRYDRHLSIVWCGKRQRWTLVRFNPNAAGVFHELHVFQGDLGEYQLPTEHIVLDWLIEGDVTKTPGATWRDKVRNYIHRQERRNRDIREKERNERRELNVASLSDYYRASRNKNGNFQDTVKYMTGKEVAP